MIRRRTLVAGLAAAPAFTVLPRRSAGQPAAGTVARVGVLTTEPGPVYAAFREALVAHGHVEGQGLRLEPRFHRGALDRVPGQAAELAALQVQVIATVGGVLARMAREATTGIPIVFAVTADPVATRLVSNAQRPGGLMTGATSFDPSLPADQVRLLKAVMPGMTRLAILRETGLLDVLPNAYRAAAEAQGLRAQLVAVQGPAPDLDAAFATMRQEGAEALIAMEEPVISLRAARIAEMATAARLPTLYSRDWAMRGPMLAYGTSLAAAARRMGGLVDRILRGALPGDLAVEVARQRELVVNQGVARAVGVAIPPAVLARADRVVD